MKFAELFSNRTPEQTRNDSRKKELKTEIKRELTSEKVIEHVVSHLQENNSTFTQKNYSDLFRAAAKHIEKVNHSNNDKVAGMKELIKKIENHFQSIPSEHQNLKFLIANAAQNSSVQDIFEPFEELGFSNSFPLINTYLRLHEANQVNNAMYCLNEQFGLNIIDVGKQRISSKSSSESTITKQCSDDELLAELDEFELKENL